MPSYTPLQTIYSSDEDIAIRADGDFAVLVPKAQKRASGSDGTVAAGLWTLTSASVNFATQGVAAGNVVQVSVPAAGKTARPGENAELFAVDSVSGLTLTLRRIGESSGVGQPPSAAGASGVAFLIQTFAPQIEDVSYELNRRYGVDDAKPGRTAADLYQIREANQACVLTVLERQCVALARQATDGGNDSLWGKAKRYAETLDDVLARLLVHWRSLNGFGAPQIEPATSRFSTRISR